MNVKEIKCHVKNGRKKKNCVPFSLERVFSTFMVLESFNTYSLGSTFTVTESSASILGNSYQAEIKTYDVELTKLQSNLGHFSYY